MPRCRLRFAVVVNVKTSADQESALERLGQTLIPDIMGDRLGDLLTDVISDNVEDETIEVSVEVSPS